jgi:hypothetical protein
MQKSPVNERDMRAYASGTQRRLIAGGVVLIAVLGTALIWWIYGAQAARLAILCILAGLAPGLLIIGWLWLLDRVLRRSGDE